MSIIDVLRICQIAKVRGSTDENGNDFPDEDTVEWIYICADAGAIDTNLIDTSPIGSPLRRIRFIVGIGHETMCFSKTVLQLMRRMGYGVLGALHSFESIPS